MSATPAIKAPSGLKVLDSLPSLPKPWTGNSSALLLTSARTNISPRQFYLQNPSLVTPPIISSSPFVPASLITHLMRNKKSSALGVKFMSRSTPPDQITDMEGALHTFVTPLLLTFMHGDYIYDGGHGVREFAARDGRQCARMVVLSASVQMDFEGWRVMGMLCAIGEEAFEGKLLEEDFKILSVEKKQDARERARYDTLLRRHMVACLMPEGRIPGIDEIGKNYILDVEDTIAVLEDLIKASSSNLSIPSLFVRLPSKRLIALDLLIYTAIHQFRNELSVLESFCSLEGGYIYTSDPPSIFAQKIGATLLNRVQILGLKSLASSCTLSKMKVFAFNDYIDRKAIPLLREALRSQPGVKVMAKVELFQGRGASGGDWMGLKGYYEPPKGLEGALLVVHNNSDAFGQNIESEWASGSLDGAVGAWSSAAASLVRDRKDLLDYLV